MSCEVPGCIGDAEDGFDFCTMHADEIAAEDMKGAAWEMATGR